MRELKRFAMTAWVALILSIWATVAVGWLSGCVPECLELPPLPREAPCVQYEAATRSVDAELVVPSIVPAPFGVRIIVDEDFNPFGGSSYPVPGGRMVWNVWVYHWHDGDYLGAIGRVPDDQVSGPVPRGGMCRWYDPL
jgi:hypothetical protein